ncbi:aromatic ring-hydroxylating dioxygenase subunit alpha [Pseudosulfitobacter sp. DSM 107133]|uniref:aromatic ring-hydroxylating oxygenase subunit alpha n=1 Tax=Pseudosulfitobacter sp. DSM 107133 TaxID=2883100 RepID=UPI000DF2FBE5|nr:aromatic ring-hydroxylating dioxygenase subunit alpha [Pseudosulfitobacter sp. DSM 107133]UOA29311.1 Carbazole 1,9a-dioxygenase, terminal oxygenase component CarAa [Pseudosulfitobacter sp. DSM 107133]
MTVIDKKALIEKRVNEGLKGQWYPVAKSVEIKDSRPFGTKLLGQKLVLWRDGAGNIRCLEDFCPHRGAPLSYGEVHDGHVACRYHGVVVDGEGVVQRVPAMPECALEGRKALQSYTVQESNDAVFVYVPSVDRPEAPELVLPKEMTSDEWTGFLCTSVWESNYRYALDNLADPMHGCYLHADSFTLAFGSKQDLMQLNKTDEGFRIERVGQTGENFDWTEFEIHPGSMFCFLDIPYPPAAGPGGIFRIIGFTTPVDENTCRVFFWRMRKVEGTARESWRFLYRAILETNHWNVLEQDRVMLEGMPDDARKREMLYQHDLGVSRIRQILTRAAKAQIEAELKSETVAAE